MSLWLVSEKNDNKYIINKTRETYRYTIGDWVGLGALTSVRAANCDAREG